MNVRSFLFLAISLLSLKGAGQSVIVHVSNPVDLNRRDLAEIPAKEVYALGDSVQCAITMLTPGDVSLKKATYWFYTSWWGSDPNMTADFCTPDTIDGTISFTSSKIALTQAGEVRIYFWGRLEYPNWDFQPVQIPVTLHVQ